MPVLTLQKAQARVQVSPRIITVACFFGPALADIRAGRFLAHRGRGLRAHQLAGLGEALADRRLDPDPVGLALALPGLGGCGRLRSSAAQIAMLGSPAVPHPGLRA